jgi:hypothetical protein
MPVCYRAAVPKSKPPRGTIVLTGKQVRELLAEGRLVRAELERRIAKMHEVSIEQRFSRAK